MEKQINIQILDLAARVGALTYACQRALELLENGDAEARDADRVTALLHIVLNAEPKP